MVEVSSSLLIHSRCIKSEEWERKEVAGKNNRKREREENEERKRREWREKKKRMKREREENEERNACKDALQGAVCASAGNELEMIWWWEEGKRGHGKRVTMMREKEERERGMRRGIHKTEMNGKGEEVSESTFKDWSKHLISRRPSQDHFLFQCKCYLSLSSISLSLSFLLLSFFCFSLWEFWSEKGKKEGKNCARKRERERTSFPLFGSTGDINALLVFLLGSHHTITLHTRFYSLFVGLEAIFKKWVSEREERERERERESGL